MKILDFDLHIQIEHYVIGKQKVKKCNKNFLIMFRFIAIKQLNNWLEASKKHNSISVYVLQQQSVPHTYMRADFPSNCN